MATKKSELPPDQDNTRVIERADGYYWQRQDINEEFGPFATVSEAVEDMELADADIDAGESLQDAESEIGIADWIDPETGQPAEESVPRLEDH